MRNRNQITKLTLAETIAHRNPEVANQFLIKYGYPASSNRDEVALKLNSFILNHEGDALKELGNIHPDRELLFSNFTSEQPAPEIKVDVAPIKSKFKHTHHNCCGHSNADGDEYSNCGGGPSYNADGKNNPQGILANNMFPAIAMIGIIGLFAMAIVSLNKRTN